jgi:hypothetical protein
MLARHLFRYITEVLPINASHITLVDAVNLLLIYILKDNPQTIRTVTLRRNDRFMTVVISDLKSMHWRCPP